MLCRRHRWYRFWKWRCHRYLAGETLARGRESEGLNAQAHHEIKFLARHPGEGGRERGAKHNTFVALSNSWSAEELRPPEEDLPASANADAIVIDRKSGVLYFSLIQHLYVFCCTLNILWYNFFLSFLVSLSFDFFLVVAIKAAVRTDRIAIKVSLFTGDHLKVTSASQATSRLVVELTFSFYCFFLVILVL